MTLRRPLSMSLFMLMVACAPATEEGSSVIEDDGRAGLADDHFMIDFGGDEDISWVAVNDTVMGGVSEGQLTYTQTGFVFEGAVSTDSNGGFTSVRSPDGDFDLSRYDRAVMYLRSEGQPFSLVLANNPYWYQGSFRADIVTDGEDWQVVEVPLDGMAFYSFQGGYPTPTGEEMTAEDRAQLYYLEFMSELFEDGDFRFEIDDLAFD